MLSYISETVVRHRFLFRRFGVGLVLHTSVSLFFSQEEPRLLAYSATAVHAIACDATFRNLETRMNSSKKRRTTLTSSVEMNDFVLRTNCERCFLQVWLEFLWVKGTRYSEYEIYYFEPQESVTHIVCLLYGFIPYPFSGTRVLQYESGVRNCEFFLACGPLLSDPNDNPKHALKSDEERPFQKKGSLPARIMREDHVKGLRNRRNHALPGQMLIEDWRERVGWSFSSWTTTKSCIAQAHGKRTVYPQTERHSTARSAVSTPSSAHKMKG